MDFYQDVPWNPATGKLKNECKKCNCNEHTDKCHFDSRVFAVSSTEDNSVSDRSSRNSNVCSSVRMFSIFIFLAQIVKQSACLSIALLEHFGV